MTDTKKSLDVLKWIEDTEQLSKPPMDLPLIGQDSLNNRLLRKTKENIFVPLGLIATATCLTLGLINLKRGDNAKQQFFMRGRVLAQGFTLLAMTAGLALNIFKKKE